MSGDATIRATIGGLLVALVLAVAGYAGFQFWGWREKRAGAYADDSICGRRIDQRTDRWVAVSGTAYDPKDPQAYQRKVAEAASKTYTADRDDFVAIVEKIRFAARTKTMKDDGICLPPGPMWPLQAFETYSKNLETRLKADPDVCRLEYEGDVVAYLSAAFPCPKPR